MSLPASAGAKSAAAVLDGKRQSKPEPILLPDLPIVDPHHHLWDGWPASGTPRFYASDLLAAIDSGHRIVATMFVECHSHYTEGDEPLLQPLGETRFVLEQAKADPRIARGIVGFVDLSAGMRLDEIIEAQIETAQGRLRGVRQSSPYDADPAFRITDPVMRDRLDTPAFRAGFARLAKHDLSFDAWCFHPNLPQLTRLARDFPDTRIILDHLGSPLGIGHYAADPRAAFDSWRTNIATLASCPNVSLKFGGLGMPMGGPALLGSGGLHSSKELARLWAPWFAACLDLFGTRRIMFESNFPVDASNSDYRTLWNAFKRLSHVLTDDERTDLFSRTAATVYKLDLS